jgi:RNA polymerase sigma-70 factor (ECF subfamily)
MSILAIAMNVQATSIDQPALPIHMGETSDFERIFLLYHAPLRYFCEQLTGADEECEDIVSQLFLTLWQKQVQFQNTAHAQAYLYRSAKNACLNFIRNEKSADEKKETLSLASTEITDSHLDTFIKTEVWAELYRAIESLPSQCCKVITLSYIEGMSNQEIADELDLSIQTIKNYKLRGLSLLKDKLPNNLLLLVLTSLIIK